MSDLIKQVDLSQLGIGTIALLILGLMVWALGSSVDNYLVQAIELQKAMRDNSQRSVEAMEAILTVHRERLEFERAEGSVK